MTRPRQMPLEQSVKHDNSGFTGRTYRRICQQWQEHIVFRPQDLVEEFEGKADYKSADESWQASIEEPFSDGIFCEIVKHRDETVGAEHSKINPNIDLRTG